MRPLGFIAAAALSAQVHAQAMVTSPAPERVAVTVYRDPGRGQQAINLHWLGGYALVSETRRIRIPAGTSEVRFEGVTSGIVPQTAIVSGLGQAVLEKNRDARLLSPGAILDASLGERLHLRRTSQTTGSVREQDAVVRSTSDGVIVETAQGVEALRCTGIPETLTAERVPATLSAKPTLSVRMRSPQPVERTVTLSYITNNFDWQADYVAELSPDGNRMSLFAWMTIANGDRTGLAGAQAQVVAGALNRERVWVDPGEARPITINCWPQGTTSDIPNEVAAIGGETITVTGRRLAAVAPSAPPPPPMPERGGDEFMATQERLGDVKLYRIPEAVTLSAKSQKQVRFLHKRNIPVDFVYRASSGGGPEWQHVSRVMILKNRKDGPLGVPLPSGQMRLFGQAGQRTILVGEGRMADKAVGEIAEIELGSAYAIRHRLTRSGDVRYELTATNDYDRPVTIELALPASKVTDSSDPLTKPGEFLVWRTIIPANGTRTLRFGVPREERQRI